MLTIRLNVSPDQFSESNGQVLISSDSNNALQLNNGVITLKNGLNPESSINKTGDGIASDDSSGKISQVKANCSVSRKQSGDPNSSNEGVNVTQLITEFKSSNGGGT